MRHSVKQQENGIKGWQVICRAETPEVAKAFVDELEMLDALNLPMPEAAYLTERGLLHRIV